MDSEWIASTLVASTTKDAIAVTTGRSMTITDSEKGREKKGR